MPVITHTIWTAIAATLATDNTPHYFKYELINNDNPLQYLTSQDGLDVIFGTKALNLVVIGKPYGWAKDMSGVWNETWPPDGLAAATAKHIAMYPQFANYKTYIWLDYVIVDLIMTENPSSRFEEMMDALDARMATLCTDLADYGFNYMGKIMSEPDETFFQPYLDDWYAPES